MRALHSGVHFLKTKKNKARKVFLQAGKDEIENAARATCHKTLYANASKQNAGKRELTTASALKPSVKSVQGVGRYIAFGNSFTANVWSNPSPKTKNSQHSYFTYRE